MFVLWLNSSVYSLHSDRLLKFNFLLIYTECPIMSLLTASANSKIVIEGLIYAVSMWFLCFSSLTDIAGFCTSEYEEVMAGLPESERDVGERLRRHLQFFFMDPMMKWRVRRQFPFKLALQVLKIIFITIQVFCLFKKKLLASLVIVSDFSGNV